MAGDKRAMVRQLLLFIEEAESKLKYHQSMYRLLLEFEAAAVHLGLDGPARARNHRALKKCEETMVVIEKGLEVERELLNELANEEG